MQYLFLGNDVKDGAFKGVSGLTVFVKGSCSTADEITVYDGAGTCLFKFMRNGAVGLFVVGFIAILLAVCLRKREEK